MEIVDASVDDGDLDACARVASGPELVNLGLNMGRESVRFGAVVLTLLESLGSLFRGDAGARGDLFLDGHVDAAHWPDRLDRRQGDNLVYGLFFIGKVFQLERCTLEEAIGKVQPLRIFDILGAEAVIEGTNVLSRIVRHVNVSSKQSSCLLHECLQTRPCRRRE